MQIRIDELSTSSVTYVKLKGTNEELNTAKEWCREKWPTSRVIPYKSNYFYLSASRAERQNPNTIMHTTITFWKKSDVMLFKLTFG